MHTTITHTSQFRDAFRSAGRESQFSYEALGLLFDYFEDNAPDMELVCIAVCCDYSEDSVNSIIDYYGIEMDTDASEERKMHEVMEYLQNHTQVVGCTSSGIVYCSSF